MMYFKYKGNKFQLLLTVFVWMLMFLLPLLFANYTQGVNWDHILKIWKDNSIVLVVFILNRYLFLPYLYFKGKKLFYALQITGTIIVFSFFLYLTDKPTPLLSDVPPGAPPFSELGHMPPPNVPANMKHNSVPAYANFFVMSILIIGFDTGLVFHSKWMEAEQNKIKLEKESSDHKLASLKNQVSPHFFMNTLNNIHALVDINSEEAKETIIKLSGIMAYMLYETQQEKVSLKKEFEFVESYINLMKLRYTKNVEVSLNIPKVLPSINVPPLLTIPFIENAFKHGISYKNPSFVHIDYHLVHHKMLFVIKNTKHKKVNSSTHSGIGLANVRKQLNLLYGSNYELAINDMAESTYEVNLNIPL